MYWPSYAPYLHTFIDVYSTVYLIIHFFIFNSHQKFNITKTKPTPPHDTKCILLQYCKLTAQQKSNYSLSVDHTYIEFLLHFRKKNPIITFPVSDIISYHFLFICHLQTQWLFRISNRPRCPTPKTFVFLLQIFIKMPCSQIYLLWPPNLKLSPPKNN